MAFGVTPQGFELKRLEDIKTEQENALRSSLGNAINLLPTELLGQIVGILSEREALVWEVMQDIYNAMYPSTANGISLDNVGSYSGIKRLQGNPSTVPVIAVGQEGTIIPAGARASVEGNPEAVFLSQLDNIIGPGVDEVQTITFSAVPDVGSFTLIFNGEETPSLLFSATNNQVQNALNSLNALSEVVVAGDFASGFVVTFAGDNGQTPQPLLELGENTLESAAVAVTVDIAETEAGVFPNVEMEMVAELDGPTEARSETLNVIETVIAGWDSVSNSEDAVLGRNVETDAEFRIRRKQSLANPGTATLEAIRARLLQLDNVLACVVYQNIDIIVDAFGRPPKSYEAVVLGGDDQEIGETIWRVGGAGIETYGSENIQIIDSQGFVQEVNFNRPTPVPIWLEVDLVTTPEFPSDGENAVIANILDFARENFSIGDDVITVNLYCPVIQIQGVVDIDFRIGTAVNPLTDDNIVIAPNEISDFDSSRISVSVS